MTFSYEIISIGGPLGCEGAAGLAAAVPGLAAEVPGLAADVPGLAADVPGLPADIGTFAPPKLLWPGPLGAFKPVPPDPPLPPADCALAGGK